MRQGISFPYDNQTVLDENCANILRSHRKIITRSADSKRVPSALNVNDVIHVLCTMTLSNRRFDPFHIINSPSDENESIFSTQKINLFLLEKPIASVLLIGCHAMEEALPECCTRAASSCSPLEQKGGHVYGSTSLFFLTNILAVEEYIRSTTDRSNSQNIQRWVPFHQLKMRLFREIS